MKKNKNKKIKIIIICSVLSVILVLGCLVGGFLLYAKPLSNEEKDYSGQKTSSETFSYLGTKFIAHRGYSDKYFQNTEEAYYMASQESFFWGIETDVRATKDGKYVCCHDNNPFVNKKKKISEMTYEEVMFTPLNPEKKGNAEVEGERFVCPFETYLQICQEGNKVAVVELKGTFCQEQINEIVEIGEKYLPKECIVYISFQEKMLEYVEEKDSAYVTEYLIESTALSVWTNISVGKSVSVHQKFVTKSLVDLAHEKNSLFAVWTVNDEEQAKEFASLGVDTITTNKVLDLAE